MTKTGIIGHRGAAGLALENSRESIIAALEHDIDGIELDIRRTKDGQLVVLHDRSTRRIAEQTVFVNDKTLEELRALKLRNGQQLPTLEELLRLIGDKKPLVIDIKDTGGVPELLRLLAAYPTVKVSATSLKYGELEELHKARPDVPIFVRDLLNPFEVLHTATMLGAAGISLNMWLMNPLTYRLAKRHGLEIRIYTVNSPWLVRFFRKLYPGVVIYTNHPERFVKRLRRRQARAKKHARKT